MSPTVFLHLYRMNAHEIKGIYHAYKTWLANFKRIFRIRKRAKIISQPHVKKNNVNINSFEAISNEVLISLKDSRFSCGHVFNTGRSDLAKKLNRDGYLQFLHRTILKV